MSNSHESEMINIDPLHKNESQIARESFFLQNQGPTNVMRIRKEKQGVEEADYNYNIHLNNMGGQNPLLASVNT